MSRRKRQNTQRTPTQQTKTTDAFSNPLFKLGYGSQSPLEATEYPLTRMTNDYALLNSLYRGNWVVQNVVGIIPDDMTKKWIELQGSISPKHIDEFNKVMERTLLKDKINEGLKWGRLYGGAAAIILIKGQEDILDKPLDLDTILPGSFCGLYLVDRWSGISPTGEIVTNMSDPEYGLPAYYQISDSTTNTFAKIHHSRIIRFIGRELPYIERLEEMYWGESEIEALYADIVKHDNTANNMAALTFRANVDTMEVANLDQIFSIGSTAQQQRFWNLMQAITVMKSNFGMQLINQGDKINNTQYSFSGLSDVYDSMCLDLAGASRIPVTKLFGRSPAGMNATGESDLQNYYDYVDSLRESKLRPILNKLLPILALSTWGVIPNDIKITFPPLWTPTAEQVAKIAKDKAETILKAFQANVIDLSTTLKELTALTGETGMFSNILDNDIKNGEGVTFLDKNTLHDPLAGF